MDKLKKIYSKIKQKTIKIIGCIKKFISSNDVELSIFGGCFFILYATFLVNHIIFLYLLGVMLFSLGVFLLKYPRGRG
ncbi:hypothetical protein CLOBY_18070 [Clostridium saccharobutylicum]|uniref:hypothetical protein n=1 Tax=Clostridium saccharobutylicum TaxID=169679 RepID=UPI000983A3FD|nr:hypothetical protein [Clostridium saccharobutylicum]AQS09676.1 hypothetical protein CLOBY_18070 [Clostridium saccharobutylicum]MBC2436929.1 hypothetical protein [Clostridium saccharobutylicum]NSB89280.1 hypothetical protein [Clostridium saccharobutylicum]NYC27934.1 hypothetical protein [Clostridium saccharobutylicum]OOM17129.1 hypothetical protein CLSAB_20770 [Clostridium saccharobutylicum]